MEPRSKRGQIWAWVYMNVCDDEEDENDDG
jgi:hypothetical protein